MRLECAYIVVTGKITVTDPNNAAYDRKLAFKNNAAFYLCVLRANNFLIEDAQDLDAVMHCIICFITVKIVKNNWEFMQLLQR